MEDKGKTKEQLINELTAMHQRVAELEKSENDHKLAEEALRESEEMFRLFMEHSPIYVFFKDEQIRSMQLSKNYEKMLGRPVHELIGKTMYDLFPSELAKSMVKDDLRILNEGKPIEVEEELNGRFYTTTKFPIIREGKPLRLAGFTMDITKAKLAEEALRESEARFRSYFELPLIGIAITSPEKRWIEVNDQICSMMGYSREELLRTTWSELTHPEDLVADVEQFNQVLAGHIDSYSMDKRFIRKNGEVLWASIAVGCVRDSGGMVKYIVALGLDITERKRAEEALLESEERYRILFETSPDAIALIDLNLNIITVNQPALMLFGYERPEEVIGKNALEFVAMNDRSRAAGDASKLLKTGRGKTGEYSIQIKDGPLVPAELRASLIRDTEGKVKCFIAVIRDISERKASEEKIRVYEEQLRSLASELTLLEERERRRIASDLHDHIGQTLALSKIKLGELRESVSPSLVKPLGEIHGLIEQTIQYTRSLTFELSPPILYELGFEAAVEWLAEQIQEKHGISVDFEDDLQPKPLGKEMRILLFKTVGELLMNVIKHAQAHKAKVAIQREGSNIRITVEDDGIGFYIPEANQLAGVKGFGLFSIRERLKHFGGSLQIQSGPRRGTLITLLAPIKQKEN
jgi:PAS domain S-box-containing protein